MIRQGFHDEDGLAATVYREAGNDYEMLYTDEDKVDMDGKTHFQPHLKPDFNIDLLRSNNYITHFLAVKRSLLDQVGGIRSDFDGAQDYDFILRCAEQAGAIGHIPRILYHWRCHKESTSENPFSKQYAVDAGKRAIGEHLKRLGVDAVVTPTIPTSSRRQLQASASSSHFRSFQCHCSSEGNSCLLQILHRNYLTSNS